MSESPEELKERLMEVVTILDQPANSALALQLGFDIQKIYQLARIAVSLDRIEKEGIFNYPRELKEDDPREGSGDY